MSEIQELTDIALHWRHVPTKQNPADQVSRGCNVDELNNSIWFGGPQFLLEDPVLWPINTHFQLSPEDEALERNTNTFTLAVNVKDNEIMDLIEKISSHQKWLRVVAYLLRWIRRPKLPTVGRDLTSDELHFSFLKIVQVVQRIKSKN